VIEGVTGDMTIRFKAVDVSRGRVLLETDDGEVPLEAVSQGTVSLLGWIGVLMQRLFEVHDQSAAPTREFALVLMDELDAHMHPEWQQQIVSLLRERFPNVQFLASTHAPLVVGGLDPEQIFRFGDGPDLGGEGARQTGGGLADGDARTLDDGRGGAGVPLRDGLDVPAQLLEQHHKGHALLVAQDDGALGARQRRGLGGLQRFDGRDDRRERGRRLDECGVAGDPRHDVLGEHDEGCDALRQMKRDGGAARGFRCRVHGLILLVDWLCCVGFA